MEHATPYKIKSSSTSLPRVFTRFHAHERKPTRDAFEYKGQDSWRLHDVAPDPFAKISRFSTRISRYS